MPPAFFRKAGSLTSEEIRNVTSWLEFQMQEANDYNQRPVEQVQLRELQELMQHLSDLRVDLIRCETRVSIANWDGWMLRLSQLYLDLNRTRKDFKYIHGLGNALVNGAALNDGTVALEDDLSDTSSEISEFSEDGVGEDGDDIEFEDDRPVELIFAQAAQDEAERARRPRRGAPRKPLDMKLFQTLWEDLETYKYIGARLGVDKRTVKNRLREMGLHRRKFSVISHRELSEKIDKISKGSMGAIGVIGVTGALRSEQIFVPRWRIRLCLKEVNPAAAALRWQFVVNRRRYYVPFINSLWHIDGHHKMFRWRIVIIGIIEGKSRKFVGLRAQNNNRAASVLDVLKKATEEHGVPSRVRADYGKELLDVKNYMIERRGDGRGSFIQGASTHNQRIERLWVDLQRWNTKKYVELFHQIEDEQEVPFHDVHLWCLHYTFLDQLQMECDAFLAAWNEHPLRTEKQLSPNLIWRRQSRRMREAYGEEWWQLDDDEDDYVRRHHDLGLEFNSYGVDAHRLWSANPGARERKKEKTVVEPVKSMSPYLRDILTNAAFLEWLDGEMPPPALYQEDFGRSRYDLCVARVRAFFERNDVDQVI
ncbi:hypothetical protein L198_08301 [Cryptococcus wingfieldii CBS 7118]|uniref:Integrase catalytic domain-containing protein n=1 Tax=Cryptococcus wingfieldii CBS 7118 TaxID=1295528 RepID=A0A1E3H9X9_9TREE|nr:hypothetical protein L198_08301 [Cryptococcus wingfieldii CBS 7118]ODN73104.1 hypothetical protein L198_08301 [Cryptococcus wingfieldii CBS 7118]